MKRIQGKSRYYNDRTKKLYSGDLNSKHLNIGNIWIANFYLFLIQMVCYLDAQNHGTGQTIQQANIFPWSEYLNSSLFRSPLYVIFNYKQERMTQLEAHRPTPYGSRDPSSNPSWGGRINLWLFNSLSGASLLL